MSQVYHTSHVLGGVTIFRLLGLAFGFELVRERVRIKI